MQPNRLHVVKPTSAGIKVTPDVIHIHMKPTGTGTEIIIASQRTLSTSTLKTHLHRKGGSVRTDVVHTEGDHGLHKANVLDLLLRPLVLQPISVARQHGGELGEKRGDAQTAASGHHPPHVAGYVGVEVVPAVAEGQVAGQLLKLAQVVHHLAAPFGSKHSKTAGCTQ